jgi:hypothetical protein
MTRGPLFRLLLTMILVCSFSALSATHYVDTMSLMPTSPYTSWNTAATTIQDAVDGATAADEVVVTNGVYATGGRGLARVVVDKPIAIRSVNGPEVTVVVGAPSVRCLYLTDGSRVSGFTFSNGNARDAGGGVWCQSSAVVVSNCVLVGNSAYVDVRTGSEKVGFGGGAYRGTFNNCIVTGNSALYGGGAYGCVLNDCTIRSNWVDAGFLLHGMDDFEAYGGYGGGVYGGTLTACKIIANSAVAGGGVFASSLNQCLVRSNSAVGSNSYIDYNGVGGGALNSVLNNCALFANLANDVAGAALTCTLTNCTVCSNFGAVGGVLDCTAFNSIIQFNSGFADIADYAGGLLGFCCTTPMPPSGFGNITNLPLIMDLAGGDLRLQPDSPCINAGNNDYVTTGTDLDGNPRVSGGVVDMGAYEFVFTPAMQIHQLIQLVNDANLGTKNTQPLVATLTAAASAVDRGNLTAAGNQLRAFEKKLMAQVKNPDQASEILKLAEQVIRAL